MPRDRSGTADLSLRALRTFAVLAEELHFGRAARRLGLSQSTVSEHLRGLENDLGVVLFERHSRGVSLSDGGRQLLEPALRLLADHEHLLQLARAAAHDRPPFVLGILAGALPLVTRLAEVAAESGIVVTVRTVTWPDGIRGVANGELDALMGVLLEALPTPTLSSIALTSSEAVVVMAPSHPFSAAERIEIHELVGHRVLVPAGYLSVVERLLGPVARSIELIETPSIAHALGELLAGGSVAVSLRWHPRWFRDNGFAERGMEPPIEGKIGLVYRDSLVGLEQERVERLVDVFRPLFPLD